MYWTCAADWNYFEAPVVFNMALKSASRGMRCCRIKINETAKLVNSLFKRLNRISPRLAQLLTPQGTVTLPPTSPSRPSVLRSTGERCPVFHPRRDFGRQKAARHLSRSNGNTTKNLKIDRVLLSDCRRTDQVNFPGLSELCAAHAR